MDLIKKWWARFKAETPREMKELRNACTVIASACLAVIALPITFADPVNNIVKYTLLAVTVLGVWAQSFEKKSDDPPHEPGTPSNS